MLRLARMRFRALGCDCEVAVVEGPRQLGRSLQTLAAARAEIAAAQAELSRFEPGSELTRLNAAGGRWSPAGRRLRIALAAALDARRETGGRFDPAVLPALLCAGYDESFERLRGRPPGPAVPAADGSIEIDPAGGRARLGPGVAVDLGGIGKGLIASWALAAAQAAAPRLPGALVDLGGDIAVAGEPPGGGPWRIAVADPRRPGEALALLAIASGGVATSGRDRRRFGPGLAQHHLIDPQTGRPAGLGPLAATVAAAHPALAEAHATALAVTPLADSEAYLAGRPGLAALLVPATGQPRVLGPLPLLPLPAPARAA